MRKTIILTAILLAAVNVFAAVSGNASIIFPLLDLGAGARALGMGEAFTAVADDASAVYWNLGGLGNIRKAQVGLTYDRWFVDTFFDQALVAYPLPAGTLGANIVYLNMGSIMGRDVFGADTKELSPYSVAGCLGYGISFGDFSAGLGLKMIGQSTGNLSNIGFAGDIGLLFRSGIFSAGLNMQNLGSGGDYYLPMNIKAGIAVRALNTAQNSLLFALDAQYLFKDAASVSAGAEYVFDNMLAARVGYKMGFGQTDLGGLKGISGGVGVKYSNFNLDYAIVPYGDLGITHRVMVSYVFSDANRVTAAMALEKEISEAKPQENKAEKKEEIRKPAAKTPEKKAAAEKKTAKKTAAAKKLSPLEAAAMLEKQGKNALAVEKYKAIILDDPKNAEAWKNLALLYKKENNKKEATGCFETYLMLNPSDKKTEAVFQKYKTQ